MKIRLLAVFVAVLLPTAASAGIRCDFTTVLTSPSYSYGGVLTIEGDRSRVDLTSGNHPLFNPNTSVITRDGGLDIIVLDHEHKTWHQRTSTVMGGHLSTTRGLGAIATPSKATIRTERTGDEHKLLASYSLAMTVEGENLPAKVELEVVSKFDLNLRQRAFPWGLQYAAKTGFEDIDRVIARRLPDRLPSSQVVTASRQIEGGPVVTETISVTIANATDTPVDDNLFFPPAGYKYQVPVFEFGQ